MQLDLFGCPISEKKGYREEIFKQYPNLKVRELGLNSSSMLSQYHRALIDITLAQILDNQDQDGNDVEYDEDEDDEDEEGDGEENDLLDDEEDEDDVS